MGKKFVYTFGDGKAEGLGNMRELLGGKGANLAEMNRMGLPVPPGFTLTTEVCNYYYDNAKKYPADLEKQIQKGIAYIESVMGAKFGDSKNPLLVSVRSGARASMPGMMETILNLGLNDETVKGLAVQSNNPKFAEESYGRLKHMYQDVVERELPQDPREQLMGAIGAVFESWEGKRAIEYRRIHHIPGSWGTACNIQAMVFGNLGDDSGTGVAFTRNPATGEKKLFGEFLTRAQGEDIVAGTRTPQSIDEMKEFFPRPYAEFQKICDKLENHFRDMQDMEFTIQKGKLWMLQTRNGKRTAKAAVKIAVDMVSEKLISKDEAILRVDPEQLGKLLHPMIDPKAKKTILTTGLPASPGAAVGRVVFNADDAVDWTGKGEKVVLVRAETSPEDIHGMNVAKGVLTSRGGMTSHAAVVARGMGIPCVAG